MPTARAQADFDCEPGRLFEVVADWGSHPTWQPTLAASEQAGPLALGSRVTETRSAFAQSVRSTFEVIEFDPGRLIRLRSLDGPMKAVQSYEIEAVPGGSRLSMSYELEPPLMLRMFEGHFVPQIAAELERSLENLAMHLRGEPAPHQSWVWQPT